MTSMAATDSGSEAQAAPLSSDKVFHEEERSMKEITRRLYTKPVMLGMAFLVGIAVVAALFVTSKSTAAPNSFPLAAGYDEFATDGDGETFHDFGGDKIDAGFFGPGSQEYAELVVLEGVPLGSESDTDTIIQRHQDVAGPGGSTSLTMTALSLKSTGPIQVTFSDGVNTWTEAWNMNVGLSHFKSSTGNMTINSSTFDSTLKVWPRFTFTRNGVTKVLDTGSGSGLVAAETGSSKIAVFENDTETLPAPEPAPTLAPAPCRIATIDTIESRSTFTSAAAASSCPPVTLSSVNQPWGPCAPGVFCITVPITEEERWAKHRPRPKKTVKIGIAE
jgi:hypothetical protein